MFSAISRRSTKLIPEVLTSTTSGACATPLTATSVLPSTFSTRLLKTSVNFGTPRAVSGIASRSSLTAMTRGAASDAGSGGGAPFSRKTVRRVPFCSKSAESRSKSMAARRQPSAAWSPMRITCALRDSRSSTPTTTLSGPRRVIEVIRRLNAGAVAPASARAAAAPCCAAVAVLPTGRVETETQVWESDVNFQGTGSGGVGVGAASSPFHARNNARPARQTPPVTVSAIANQKDDWDDEVAFLATGLCLLTASCLVVVRRTA